MMRTGHVAKRNHFFTRLAPLFFAAVFVASMVTSAIPVQAAGPVDSMPVDKRIKSFLYYHAVAPCFDGINDISNAEVAENRYSRDEEVGVGWYVDSEDGRRECQNLLPDALSTWGYPDFATALKDWGYALNSAGTQWHNDNNIGQDRARAIINKVYGGQTPSLSGYDKYAFYAKTLQAACSPSGGVEYAKANAGQKAAVAKPNAEYVRTSVVQKDGENYKNVDMIYKVERVSDDTLSPRDVGYVRVAEKPGGIPEVMTCYEIAQAQASNANSFLRWANTNKVDAAAVLGAIGEPGTEGPDDKSSCLVDGIGWIVCPVMNFMAKIVDQAYKIVSQLLTVNAFNNESTVANKPLYAAWSNMRNVANVAFVMAFLIIIYSQITGVGLSNYGIKKMLPRIIVSAILVNVSYWICAIAVDISNIAGSSMNQLIQNAGGEGVVSEGVSSFADGTGWQGITGGVLAGTAAGLTVLYIGLAALGPALVAALAAIVTVLLVLTLRQALIILLIVIAPLAFVAFLLPNTEQWFKKWKDLFVTLLLMYPIIALIFGASALASQIVMKTAPGGTGAGDESLKVAIQIMGALISILPLAITPVVMKTAGGVLNRFGGFVNNPNKGPFDKMRKGAENVRERQQGRRAARASSGGRVFGGGQFRRRAKRSAVDAGIKAAQSRAEQQHVADQMTDSDGNATRFGKQVAGGSLTNGPDAASLQRALAGAQFTIEKAETEEIKAASAVIERMNLSSEQLNTLAKGGSVEKNGRKLDATDSGIRKAAISDAVSMGTVADVESIIKSAGTMSEDQHKILSSSIARSGIAGKAKYLGGQTLDDIAQGKIQSDEDLNRVAARTIEKGKFSAEEVAASDPDALKRLSDVASQSRTDLSTSRVDALRDSVQTATSDSRISGRIIDAQKVHLEALVPGSTGGGTSPTQLNIEHTQTAREASASSATPTPQKVTVNYTRADIQNMGSSGVTGLVGGVGKENLSDADIAKLANATKDMSGAEAIHTELRGERDLRRNPPNQPNDTAQ